MNKSKLIQIILSVGEFFFVAIFLVSCWQSDRALDKSGIGDPEKFTFWNGYAGLSVKCFAVLWIVAVVLSLIFKRSKDFDSKKAYWRSLVPTVLLPPLVLVLGWLVILI